MKKYFKYIAVLLSFVMVFSLSGFAALQTATNVFAADSPSAGDNSGTGSKSPSAGDNTGDNTGSDSPSAGDNSDDGNGSGELQSGDWKYTINEDGTVKLTEFSPSSYDTKPQIPSEIDGRQVTIIGEGAIKNRTFGSYALEIPEGIKKIENAAISWSGFSKIVVPKSLVEVEGQPFQTIDTPIYGYKDSVVEEVVNNGDYARFYCLDYDYPTSGDYTYRINNDGTVTIVSYNGSATEVEVPAAIDGRVVTRIGNYAFYKNNSKIVSVKLPDSIVKIGGGAFYKCNYLEEIDLPDSITEIGRYAFCECNSLLSLIIPKNVKRIEPYVFYHSVDYLSVTIPAGVNYMDYSSFVYGIKCINGYANSYAEEFAKAHNIKFNVIGTYEEVEAGSGSDVSTDVIADAIANGTELIFEVKGTDGNPVVKYTFDGSKFTKAPDANFKLDVTCGEKNEVTDKVKEQLNVTGDDSLFLCNFEHSGELNGELEVTVYPNYDNGTELKLFYYNETTGEAEDMGQTVKVVNGEVTFTVTHFSSYLLVKTADIVTPSEPDTTEPENPSESEPETTEPNTGESEPETTNPETTPSETQPETTPGQTETESESGNYVAPSTGAGTGTAAALVGVMLMACGAAGVCIGKRRK